MPVWNETIEIIFHMIHLRLGGVSILARATNTELEAMHLLQAWYLNVIEKDDFHCIATVAFR